MTPTTIKKKEDLFFSTLKPSSGVQYTLKSTTDIGGVNIYSIRPGYDSYYYATKTTKKSICLHFTVGYIGSDVSTLSKADSHVSVSYTVDRCGRVYELFDDAYWSYHLGNAAVGGNGTMSKQSIGIEISNYGPLKLDGSNLIDAYGNVYCTLADKDSYFEHEYRGYKYYATMTDVQIDAIVALLKHLSKKHDIPLSFKMDDQVFTSASEATWFRGIYCHTNVRKDKFDWPFCTQIQEIISKCTESTVIPPVQEPATTESTEDTATTESQPVDAKSTDNTAVTEQPTTKTKPTAQKPSANTASSHKPQSGSSIIEQIIQLLIGIFGKK